MAHIANLTKGTFVDTLVGVDRIPILLGSGVGSDRVLKRYLKPGYEDTTYSYSQLLGAEIPMAKGHPGKVILSDWCGVPVAVFRGRIHGYQGLKELLRRLCSAMIRFAGHETHCIVNNTVGALVAEIPVGAVLLPTQIFPFNFPGAHYLDGSASEFVNPESSILKADSRYNEVAQEAGAHAGLKVVSDIKYGVVLGPDYETPLVKAFLRSLGLQSVGMSLITESGVFAAENMHRKNIIMAQEKGEDVRGEDTEHLEMLKVAPAQLTTNNEYAPRPPGEETNHHEVQEAAEKYADELGEFFSHLIVHHEDW